MDVILIVGILIVLYLIVAFQLSKFFPRNAEMVGPFLLLKSEKTAFFDRFVPYASFLKKYGSFGILMMVLVSILMLVSIGFTFVTNVQNPPPPTGVYEPQNILMIPGINNFIPSTIAVLFGLFITIMVHEFGHAILCRVENVRIKSIGVVFFLIPLGFFVDPENDDMNSVTIRSRNRIFSAGVTNNIVIGLICFILVISMVGFIVPKEGVFVYGVYENSPAHIAGIQPDDIIYSIDGERVNSYADMSRMISSRNAGDSISVSFMRDGKTITKDILLYGTNKTGQMGVLIYSQQYVSEVMKSLVSPSGILYLMILPLSKLGTFSSLQIIQMIMVDTFETKYFEVPFPFFWIILQTAFWCGWININVGLFNAIPMLPLDGGKIMKNTLESYFEKNKWYMKYGNYTFIAISLVIFITIVATFLIPHLLWHA